VSDFVLLIEVVHLVVAVLVVDVAGVVVT